jgi:hypothetical protein
MRRGRLTSRSAAMTTTLEVLRPILPPALPRNVCLSERDLASKIGNSTHAWRTSTPTGAIDAARLDENPSGAGLLAGSEADMVKVILNSRGGPALFHRGDHRRRRRAAQEPFRW